MRWAVLLAATALATGCGEASSVTLNSRPQVAITVEAGTVEPAAAQLFSSVVGGDGQLQFSWDFGDGETASEANPQHTFVQAGTYSVSLTVTDEDGDTGRSQLEVVVANDEMPDASISAEPALGVAPLVVALECAPTAGNAPHRIGWRFGDGDTGQGGQVTHTFTTAGNFVVSCDVNDVDGDRVTETIEITVGSDDEPAVVASATPTAGVAPLVVDLSAVIAGGNAPVIATWDFGDGETGTGTTVSHTYASSGVFPARVIATDADGDTAVAVVGIAVSGATAPIATAAVVTGACAVPGSTTVELDATSSSDPDGDVLSFQWSFAARPPGSTASISSSSAPIATFVPDRAGNYLVQVAVTDGINGSVSSPVTVTADGAAAISAVSGLAQSGEVATELAEPLVLEVENGCGALVPGAQVGWVGDNARPLEDTTLTSQSGRTAVLIELGTRAGAASIRASSGGASASFAFTANPGPPDQLLMDSAHDLSAVDGAHDLTFRITDRFGNATAATDITFDLAIAEPDTVSATLGTCGGVSSLTGIATVSGVATVAICDNAVEDVFLTISGSSNPDLVTGGTVVLVQDDMERDDPAWIASAPFGNAWQRGTPSVPTDIPAAPSPPSVRGTELASALSSDPGSAFSSLSRGFDLNFPGTVLAAELRFQHYVDLAGCAEATLFEGCAGCTPLTPAGGYGGGCFFGAGFSGRTDQWSEVRFDLSSLAGNVVDLAWAIFWGDQLSGGGWFIDDVIVELTVATPRVSFGPGPAAALDMIAARRGVSASCDAAIVAATVLDTAGNEVADGTAILLSTGEAGVTFPAALEGRLVSGAGTSSIQVETVAGRASVLVLTSGGAGSALVQGDIGGTTDSVAASFDLAAAEACGDGIDNDCDGARDCADSDCQAAAACNGSGGETCDNGADDDADAAIDCEDSDCMFGASCQSGANGADSCNGVDDEGSGGIDEAACNCVSDAGCNDLVTGGPFSYVCHAGIGVGAGACFVDCRDVNWCSDASLLCDAGTGRCIP